MVQTPLWTDRPEKMKQFGYDPATAVTPEKVADTMIELVTNGQYAGGTCLEVSVSGSRSLGIWNIEPPKSSGTRVPQEVIDENYAPMISLMNKERGSSGHRDSKG